MELVTLLIFITVFAFYLIVSQLKADRKRQEFNQSMTDISVSEKYLTTNKKIGLLYDNTQKKARIINYENHKYQDIDEVELGFASEFFDTILFTDKNENSITFASYTTEEKQKSAFKISKIENIKTDKFIRNKKKGSYYVKEDLEPCVIIDNKEKKILLLNDIEYPSEKMRLRGECPWMGTYPPSQIS